MSGSLTRRQRRPLWGWSTVFLLFALAACLFVATRAKTDAIAAASNEARLTAQTELATLLEPADLAAPVASDRAVELGAGIEAQITSVTPIDEVRIYSSLGRILYADDPEIVGTRPSYLRDLTFAVASGETQAQVRGDVLQTLVPIWLTPGGTVVVAEMSQPIGPVVAPATATWSWAALACGVLLVGAIALLVLASRSKPAMIPAQVPVVGPPPQVPANTRPVEAAVPQTLGRDLEASRRAAEQRAEAAEQNLRGIQKQLTEALARNTELEARLVAAESTSHTSDSESAALREQLSRTTERLNAAEIDAKALRERLSLRQQELEEAQSKLASARATSEGAEELKRRLEVAETRADEMANEMARMEADLDYAAGQFHMTKLSEALRDIEHGEVDDGSALEHPVIIRGNGGGRKVG